MKIQRVEVQGFRSFRELETFDFDASPGLVNLTGVNDDEPMLGANGAGKSSLWEAILWCLYGSTSTGLKGPEVASWGQGRGIYVLVRANGHKIVRTWGPNTLLVDGEDAKQERVDEVVGLTREQFLSCTYMAQHSAMFLDLGATAKTDLLASILDLDKWLEYSAEAQTRARAVEGKVRDAREALVTLDASVRTLEGTDYALLHQEWVRKKREGLVAGALEIEEAAQRVEKGKNRVLQPLRRSIEILAAEWVAAEKKANERQEELTRQRALVRTLADRVEADAKARKKGVCEACGQRLPHSHVTREQAQVLELRLHTAEAKLKGMLADERVVRRAEAKQVELADEKDAYRRAEKEVWIAVQALEQLEDQQSKLRVTRSPYEGLIVDKAQNLERLRGERKVLEAELARVEAEHEMTVQWVQMFKDVRLFLVAEALLQLEVEVNSSLAQLGLQGWSIHFAPDSETKAGAVKRGFSVSVLSPNNERPVPWQVWSGGEAQRLRLAASMGLSNLIAVYTGYRAFVEVWDEPTNGMSEEGIADLLTAMRERVERNGRQIWIIDHRALDSGVFQQTVTAIKQDGTTKLQGVKHGQGE